MAELNYEEDLAIDPSILDEEWLEHAAICKEYIKALNVAQKELDKLEELKKVTIEDCKDMVARKQAEIDLDIRSNPEKYDCPMKNDKPYVTEAWVTAKLATSADLADCKSEAAMKKARVIDDFIDKTYEVNMLKGAVEVFTFQRKASLENLVTLHGQNYFAGPKEPRNLPDGKRLATKARERIAAYQAEQAKNQRDRLNNNKEERKREEPGGSGSGPQTEAAGGSSKPLRKRSTSRQRR